jgi:hypothetical protein
MLCIIHLQNVHPNETVLAGGSTRIIHGLFIYFGEVVELNIARSILLSSRSGIHNFIMLTTLFF